MTDNKSRIEATFDHFLNEMKENGELKTTENESTKKRSFLILLTTVCFAFLVGAFLGFLPSNPLYLVIAYFGFQMSISLSD